MKKSTAASKAPAIQDLLVRIEDWRKAPDKSPRMPMELWNEAVDLAKRYGVHIVARDLGLGYKRLKKLTAEKTNGTKKPSSEVKGFVEISNLPATGHRDSWATEVEILRPDGAKITIRQNDSSKMDMGGLVTAFCRGGR